MVATVGLNDNTLLSDHELTRVWTCISSIFQISHTRGQRITGYCKIFLRRVQPCSLYYKNNYFYWYLGFYCSFSVTRISNMTDRDWSLSNNLNDFGIDIEVMWKLIVYWKTVMNRILDPQNGKFKKKPVYYYM